MPDASSGGKPKKRRVKEIFLFIRPQHRNTPSLVHRPVLRIRPVKASPNPNPNTPETRDNPMTTLISQKTLPSPMNRYFVERLEDHQHASNLGRRARKEKKLAMHIARMQGYWSGRCQRLRLERPSSSQVIEAITQQKLWNAAEAVRSSSGGLNPRVSEPAPNPYPAGESYASRHKRRPSTLPLSSGLLAAICE